MHDDDDDDDDDDHDDDDDFINHCKKCNALIYSWQKDKLSHESVQSKIEKCVLILDSTIIGNKHRQNVCDWWVASQV